MSATLSFVECAELLRLAIAVGWVPARTAAAWADSVVATRPDCPPALAAVSVSAEMRPGDVVALLHELAPDVSSDRPGRALLGLMSESGYQTAEQWRWLSRRVQFSGQTEALPEEAQSELSLLEDEFEEAGIPSLATIVRQTAVVADDFRSTLAVYATATQLVPSDLRGLLQCAAAEGNPAWPAST